MKTKSALQLFAADKKAEVGSIATVKVRTIHFHHYTFWPSCEQDEKETFIHGNDFVLSKEETVLNVNALFSALAIGRSVDFRSKPNLGLISTNEILKLYYKYGLLEGIGPAPSLYGLKLSILDLYSRFAAYMAICTEDVSLIRQLFDNEYLYPVDFPLELRLDLPLDLPLNFVDWPFSTRELLDEDVMAMAKKSIASEEAPYPFQSLVLYDEKRDQFRITYYSEDFFEACNTLLSLLIARGKAGSQNIKVCVECGKYFMGHGNAAYCGDPCNRKTAHSRRVRREQRSQAKTE